MTPAEYPDADLIVLYLIVQFDAVAWLLVKAPMPIKPPQELPPDVTMQFSTIQLVAVAWLLV